MKEPAVWDAAVCGGGLAGLTLARQLRREIPEASIVILETTPRPLPPAAFKVGESSVELSSHYFGKVLGLEDYLKKAHLPKLGLRFFFGNSQGPFGERPEFGESVFPRLPSFQLDRGILEEDLRRMNEADGVRLMEGSSVEDILIQGAGPHEVLYRGPQGPGRLKTRWVVDALGRRRLLQAKFGLKRDNGHRANAAWFRAPGRLDVDDLVPASDHEWHDRVPEKRRWFSTNHLMGAGYWVWLIPLSSGNTSVGIVADEVLHPFREYATYEAARAWLKRHEPALDAYLGERPILDFRKLKQFSHSSTKVFSSDRWACTGEAGVFLDPFYSPGSDFIATSNTITLAMMKLDRAGALTSEISERFNRFYLGLNENMVEAYRDCYPLFGSAGVMRDKILWDFAFYWACTAQFFFHGIVSRADLLEKAIRVREPFLRLNKQMQERFRSRGPEPGAPGNRYTGVFDHPEVWPLNFSLFPARPPEEVLEGLPKNLAVLEKLAGGFAIA